MTEPMTEPMTEIEQLREDNKNLLIVLAQKDNEIYELRQTIEGERWRITDRVVEQQAAEIERQRKVIEEYERARISRLGGIGSPA